MKTKTVYVVQSSPKDVEFWEDDYFGQTLEDVRLQADGYRDAYRSRIIKRTEEVIE